MKKSSIKKVILLLVIGVLIISCSKDDNPQSSSTDLIGVWNCTSLNYTGTTDTEFQGESIIADFVGEGYNIDFEFTINENPNVATSKGSYNIKLTSIIQGQTFVQNSENLAFTTVGSWNLEGSKMTISQNGETSIAMIKELTETSLELSILDERTFSSNGATVTSVTDTHITFTK